jgi:valyl-tRNA synthetase
MSKKEIEKSFNYFEDEKKIYQQWVSKGLFKSNSKSLKKKYSIMMPPPNVTGTLHVGHALNMTIQDILARFWRMNNKEVLWQPGTDHAGIATQKIVESNLKKNKNLNKKDLGKKKFIDEIWKWKSESGKKIVNQIKRLGASPDWSRERFTLDKGMSNAVNHVFLSLFNKGLIYKDKRITNWDLSLQTAISDLEVEQKEQEGQFVYIKYFFEDRKNYLEVATTRPETLFGDQCLAVNPLDERYKKFIGEKVWLPLTNKKIPIIADEYVDKEKGSGVLKVTPAHDFNDHKVGIKHNLQMCIVFDKYGKFNENVPSKYKGKDRLIARKEILEDLKKANCLIKIEKIIHSVPYGDRSGSVIEPYLTDQWFLNVKPLARDVIKKVKNKETKFYPPSWNKTFFNWMNSIEPWCISRQIWWGHRIPVWYGPDNKIFTASSEKEAQIKSDNFYKKKVTLNQETDVLDTWFSSALWPMATLGWPDEENVDFESFFPTSVLVTGFDIIFFWVARMMMQSNFFTNQLPFKDVYIHALVRDKYGNKMSKSKGNVIDPLKIIDSYGADALRLTLALMAAQGRDIKLSEDTVKVNRNFVTKIRNAYKFLNKNNCFESKEVKLDDLSLDKNVWILYLLNTFIFEVSKNIKFYRFNDAAKEIYKFTKNIYCDWYLEFIKIALEKNKSNELVNEIKYISSFVYISILKIAHPFIPFVTDDIYVNAMGNKKYLMETNWPDSLKVVFKDSKFKSIEKLISIISKIRNIKSTLKIQPKHISDLFYIKNDKADLNILIKKEVFLNSLARVKLKKLDDKKVEINNIKYLKFIYDDYTFFIDKSNSNDNSVANTKDTNMLNDQLISLDQDIALLTKKIENKEFIKKAPFDVVNKFRNKVEDKIKLKNKILNEIKSL